MNHRKIIDGWVIISIFVIIILIAINIPYTTAEPYTDKEYYIEQEPYTTTETYYEKEPYIENVPLNLNTTVDWYITMHPIDDKFDFNETIKNIDHTGENFSVTFHIESTRGSYDITTNKVFLKPGDRYQTKRTFDGIFSYATYLVHQPTKEVTRYSDVPKERTITGYQDISKSREVIKLKESRGSLLQRILNVNS